ncbi:M6 family metalloprotease domain-containing protein [Streptomyces sp. H27-D2]|uniref:M6 family metalloprotease domain-containing protein n=1 Tax=Streptomyces sp. H27-D2 TaxID=3046304 RepID=UPI002DBEA7BB|nr:M6 family metalloprotease domain-containing protein [Streptomyces sp. H27-D2]MEC4015295.1 M6 family metalloprotease domain-containing protein [Streptomyces sp. H27-D2]
MEQHATRVGEHSRGLRREIRCPLGRSRGRGRVRRGQGRVRTQARTQARSRGLRGVALVVAAAALALGLAPAEAVPAALSTASGLSGAATGPGSRADAASIPTGACALGGPERGGTYEGLPTPAGFARSQGTVKALTLFIDFPDAPAWSNSPSDRFAEFFPAATRYFDRSSYGKLAYRPTPHLRWIRMARPFAGYRIRRGTGFDPGSRFGYGALSREIVNAVDASVDFAAYDVINVLASPDAGPEATDDVLSVTFSGGMGTPLETGDGVRFGNVSFIWSRQTGPSPFRVLNHETAHSFGLPDLYLGREDATRAPTGHWDLMDEGWGPSNDFLGWHKWKMGWLDAGQVDCAGLPGGSDHTLTPTGRDGGTKIVVVPTSPSSALVVEARENGELDQAVCRPGVLVYRVDTRTDSGDGPVRVADATPGSQGCYLHDVNVDADLSDATHQVGDTYQDARSGIGVAVTEQRADGDWRVRVTRP